MVLKASSVSVHGGHSAEFCSHAEDSLEAIVKAYVEKRFVWVGITEHLPPIRERFIYPEEQKAGLDVPALLERFRLYFQTGKQLKNRYRDQIEIFVGFETETYTGSEDFIQQVVTDFAPEYMVGSLHHTGDVEIDMSPEAYAKAVEQSGGIEPLYCRYFDEQHKMLQALKPAVVGHFDLVRYFDPDYRNHLQLSEVRKRIERNLAMIKALDLILELNLAGFDKTAAEPYPSRDILTLAVEMGVDIVPADDSHGVRTTGRYIQKGISLLEELGCDLNWRKPVA